MPQTLQRGNTLKKLLLTKRDSIRITETLKPVRWRPLGVQRSLYDDFAHLLFEWTYGRIFVFVASAYLAVITAFAVVLYLSVSLQLMCQTQVFAGSLALRVVKLASKSKRSNWLIH